MTCAMIFSEMVKLAIAAFAVTQIQPAIVLVRDIA